MVYTLPLLIVAVANFILGVVIFLRNSRNTVHIYLSAFSFFVAIWSICIAIFFEALSVAQTLFWVKGIYTTGTLISVSLFQLAYALPNGKKMPKTTFALSAIPPLIFIIIILVNPYFLISRLEQVSWGTDVILDLFGYAIFTAIFSTYFYGAIFMVFKKYKTSEGVDKLKLFYILISVLVAGIGAPIFNLILPWFRVYSLIWIGPFFTLFIVLTIIYAIVKHRFLDIKLIVARSVAYSLLVTILAGGYAFGLFVVGNYITQDPSSVASLVTSTILALIMAFTFQPLRRRLERATDKIFYRDRYDVNRLLGLLGRLMASTYDLTDLSNGVLGQIRTKLKATEASIVLLKGTRIDWSSADKSKLAAGDIKKIIAVGSTKSSNALVFDELEEGETKEIMRKNEFSIVVPLIAERILIGALILGEKASGDVYTSEDINVLEIIGPQVSVAIDNAKAYEEIKQFNIKLRKEIEEATSNLRGANKRLRELDKIKDEFISITSHELRTPMTAVKSYLWMVINKSGKNLGKQGLEHLNRAYVSTQRTINLVNDMLDVSRIEGNRFEINKEKLDIVELANESVNGLMGKAKERRVKLIVEKKKMPSVFVDRDKIFQVMDNLIGNALKFTSKGGSITIKFMNRGKMLGISVKDTGTGISKSDQKRLFKKFGRLENSYVSMAEVGGTGLGLYVSKQIVEMHGGKIWIESEIGKGSMFLFTVPIVKE